MNDSRRRSRFCAFTAIALLWMTASAASLHAQLPASSSQPLRLGAAWYPEQWPESRWDEDLRLMEQAHLNVVRVGEFAWSRMEPAEGRYDLDWLARAIRLAEKHHIGVVIGTPTDAPPAWLTSAHPETLRVDAAGHRAEHGGRRQFNYANPVYRAYCEKIAAELARRFGHDPDVIGWQIGNEFTDESFDDATRGQFQSWLQRRFGTLDALNSRWATAYWSQTYDRWDEIPLNAAAGNPGLMLEHRHFVTDTWRDFQHVQIAAIRRFADPRQFITTNIGGLGWSDNFDHYEINRDLDLAAWDDYVGEGHLNAARNAFMHDFVRGWRRANFWVMETQPGFVNWAPVNNSLDRGETRAMTWQAIGYGADAVLFWQWRSAPNGQEQYHGALAGADGSPLPIYTEVQQIGGEFATAAQALAGTTPSAQVAILHSYDSRWAIDYQPHNRNYDQLDVLLSYYEPLRQNRLTVDVVNASAPLASYKLVLAPDLNVISQELAAQLLEYVRQGGRLVLGPRSGMKDQYNALNPERQPGPLVDALGGRVEQYYALESPVPVTGDAGSGTASLWAEQLSARDENTQIPLRYGTANGWLDGQPAILTRQVGKGRITYIGAVLEPALMHSIVDRWVKDAGLQSEFEALPDGVELCRRLGKDHAVYIFINHGASPADIRLPQAMRDVLHGNAKTQHLALESQGIAVLESGKDN